MLRSCGWQAIQYLGEEIYLCQDRSADVVTGVMHGIPAGFTM